MFVLCFESEYTVKYRLSFSELNRTQHLKTPLGSRYISLYIPHLVIHQSFSIVYLSN